MLLDQSKTWEKALKTFPNNTGILFWSQKLVTSVLGHKCPWSQKWGHKCPSHKCPGHKCPGHSVQYSQYCVYGYLTYIFVIHVRRPPTH